MARRTRHVARGTSHLAGRTWHVAPGTSHVARFLLTFLFIASAASAQTLPVGPISAFDGQVLVSGEVVATYGDTDKIAFFNYTDYEHNALRMLRLGVSAAWKPLQRVAFVGEIRSEDLEQAHAFAAYVRVRPWLGREFDIQVGRIPPTFGAFSRRAYNTDNPLIGYPLAYQYLTSIRPDAIPATTEDLLRMRARGWRSSFPVGVRTAGPGVPLISAFEWDTGAQARWNRGPVELTGAVTTGTLSDPRVSDNNDGLQVSGRIALRPIVGLIAGVSAARGDWIGRNITRLLPQSTASYAQTAWGADAEYSRDHWLVRTEIVRSRWLVPFAITDPAGENLDAFAAWVEGRYRLTPRIFAAARADHLGFSRIFSPQAGRPTEWDAPVARVEIGAGYYFQRNLVARISVQRNDRHAGRVEQRTYFSGQLSYWF